MWLRLQLAPKASIGTNEAYTIQNNPIAYGGLFGPCYQTGSQNSRTLSPRVSKISDFSFMPFGHTVAKFQAN